MNKKFLVTAIMATMTLSAASTFAAPIISGDAYLEYDKIGENKGIWDSRIRFNADTQLDNKMYLHGRMVVANPDLQGSGNALTAKFDEAYFGAKLDNMDVRVGNMELYSGKGLLMDDQKFVGVKATGALEGTKLHGFIGKDASANKVGLAEFSTSLNGVNFGANYLKLADTKYWGINADTQITDDAVLNVEYVKNSTDSADGYLAGVTMGNYTVSYRDIKPGAIDAHTTNSNYVDSKGFKLSAHYALGKNSSVTLYQDMATDHNNNDKHRTNVEFDVNF